MAFNSNGQVQYLILDSLADGSKYGLEIIEFISKKTNGGYILKKPTLYSCLTRLEKKGYVSSSFWGESEFGGKRHYYALTNEGRENLKILSKEFEHISFTSSDNEIDDIDKDMIEENVKPMFLSQENLFDLAKKDSKEEEKKEEVKVEPEIAENQMDLFSYPAEPEKEEVESVNADVFSFEDKEEEKQDDGKFLSESETLTPFQLEQNKKIFNTSSELKKYRNRKSFSDNQMQMPVEYEKKQSEEEFQEKIKALKESILQTKQNTFDKETYYPNSYSSSQEEKVEEEKQDDGVYVNEYYDPYFYKKPKTYDEQEETEEVLENVVEERKDDATFITEQIGTIPVQKRITPPNIEINVSDENLPAPMRDSQLEPTYNDMVSKVMEKKKEKQVIKREPRIVVDTNTTFADYESLKGYYNNHGLTFKEYKKSTVERIHNTNFLKFISSIVLFLLSGIGSGILYWIISANNLLMPTTNFMFYTFPILFAVYALYEFIRYKTVVSKKASQRYNAIINWAVFVLSAIVVFVINICFGMQAETMIEYLTSILTPIYALLLICPVNYYITKFIYKKWAK